MRALVFGVVGLCFVLACGDDTNGSGSGGSGAGGESPGGTITVRGGVEKGPLVLGSGVTIAPLDAALAPTGALFTTQTASDQGDFLVTAPPGLAGLEATGFHFNELAGELSTAPIVLRATSVVDASNPVFINVV
ncbi:MAG: hypothetical protein HOV80_18370, partial [Polyangiaceae bacterium]|nr:hypothetical protein [Polyangiaceae bacterium]